MSLAPGTRLGPYEILGPIGAGGMGEVYKARDARLDRHVAIKVLPAAFAEDTDRLARFGREAKAIAALSHPNILAIFDTGVHERQAFVVTELLEGETLRARLQSGALPVRKSIDLAVQIARGLAAAHDKGLVHRDLKPENLFLLKDGQVKILDFGLAKEAAHPNGGLGSAGGAETATAATDPGIVLGTIGYMAPEQLRGQPVDARADLFAFGAVLYEMLSGRRAFQRRSAADTTSAILNDDPPELSTLDRVVPSALERLVRRCLEKAPVERFQSARDLAFALEAISGPASADAGVARGPAAPSQPPSRMTRASSRLPWLLVGGLSVIVVVLGLGLWKARTTVAPPVRTLRLATGTASGVYYSVGQGLAEVLGRKLPNTEVAVRSTDGSFENMALLDRGEVDLALAQNDVAFHSVKTDRVLKTRSTHIAALCLLYPEPAQIIVSRRSNVKTISDLRGKRIAMGPRQGGAKFSSEILLTYFGLREGDYDPHYVDDDAVGQLVDGSLDAFIVWAGIPAPAYEDVFKTGQVTLLSMDAESLRGLRIANPFLVPIIIPAHVYPNQQSDVSTIGVKAMLAGRTDLDDATVDKILTAIFGSIPDLIAHHPRASEISLAHASSLDDGLSIDLHPAARRFFDRQAAGKTP